MGKVISIDGTKIKIVIDSDKDGKNAVLIEVDIIESLDEVNIIGLIQNLLGKIFKK